MGFDEDKIDKIGDHEDIELDTDPEVLARHEDIGSDRKFSSKGYQDQVRNILVTEAYIMLDVEGTGTATLHKVMKAGNVLLRYEEGRSDDHSLPLLHYRNHTHSTVATLQKDCAQHRTHVPF